MEGEKMGAKRKLPQSAHFYLWYQLIGKRKPIQKALDNTYAYWKGLLDGEPGFPDEAEARRLLKQAAKLILKGGGNEIEKRTLVESLLRQKLMVIVKRFIQVVKKSLQIAKLKRRKRPPPPILRRE